MLYSDRDFPGVAAGQEGDHGRRDALKAFHDGLSVLQRPRLEHASEHLRARRVFAFPLVQEETLHRELLRDDLKGVLHAVLLPLVGILADGAAAYNAAPALHVAEDLVEHHAADVVEVYVDLFVCLFVCFMD